MRKIILFIIISSSFIFGNDTIAIWGTIGYGTTSFKQSETTLTLDVSYGKRVINYLQIKSATTYLSEDKTYGNILNGVYGPTRGQYDYQGLLIGHRFSINKYFMINTAMGISTISYNEEYYGNFDEADHFSGFGVPIEVAAIGHFTFTGAGVRLCANISKKSIYSVNMLIPFGKMR